MLSNHNRLPISLTTIALIFFGQHLCAITMNSRHDPFPVFTSLDPHTFLYTREKQEIKGYEINEDWKERVSISINAYGQNADEAKNICKNRIELGDINGRWGMIGLLFGELPEGETLPPALEEARQCLFPTLEAGTINDPQFIDKIQQFGFFSNPQEYRKRGVRFELSGQLCTDVGMKVRIGIADICHTTTSCDSRLNRINKTSENSGFASSSITDKYPNFTEDNVNKKLMCKLECIAPEICVDLADFNTCSAEDLQLALYWRHAYAINEDREGWPEFLVIPYLMLEGSLAIGKDLDRNQPKALSFGSNDHHAVGFTAGLNVDFYDTIEIGFEAGITNYFGKDFCKVSVPTSKYQSAIFPFTTDVNIDPGHNVHFGLKLFAYDFLEHLSFHFQYYFISHKKDDIKLLKSDCAFKPQLLENVSAWKVHVANVGFNYEISPHFALGFFWQAPLKQINTFRSTTIMLGITATF